MDWARGAGHDACVLQRVRAPHGAHKSSQYNMGAQIIQACVCTFTNFIKSNIPYKTLIQNFALVMLLLGVEIVTDPTLICRMNAQAPSNLCS
jgi:hypothetical protein